MSVVVSRGQVVSDADCSHRSFRPCGAVRPADVPHRQHDRAEQPDGERAAHDAGLREVVCIVRHGSNGDGHRPEAEHCETEGSSRMIAPAAPSLKQRKGARTAGEQRDDLGTRQETATGGRHDRDCEDYRPDGRQDEPAPAHDGPELAEPAAHYRVPPASTVPVNDDPARRPNAAPGAVCPTSLAVLGVGAWP